MDQLNKHLDGADRELHRAQKIASLAKDGDLSAEARLALIKEAKRHLDTARALCHEVLDNTTEPEE